MDNHYHLLVERPQPNLSLGMRQLNGRYTQAPPWLTTDWILHQFGPRVGAAQERYRPFVAEERRGPRSSKR